MKELVLDASVVVKWFDPSPARHAAEARAILDEFEDGRLLPVVPSLLFVEVLNVAGRHWRSAADELLTLAERLQDMRFTVAEADLGAVAVWVGRGLTAYDAVYVSLAEARGIRLVTDDRQMLTIAPDLTQPLGG